MGARMRATLLTMVWLAGTVALFVGSLSGAKRW